VVIPTPTGDQKREIERLNREYNEPIGVSQLHFPIDAHKKSVAKGAYPALRTVDRSTAVLGIATLSPARPNSISAVKTQLVERLRSKLASIKGPGVTVAPRDELALARTTQNFQFVNSYQLRAGVKPIDEVFNSGCSCGDACSPENCNCVDNDPLSNAKIVPYERAADGSRLFVLTPQLLGKSSMIYECNRRCDCAGHCWNAVVQKSRTVRLEIFRTQNRGFGSFPALPFPARMHPLANEP
jgi:histone-lysine N-methyltransferase SUV39H